MMLKFTYIFINCFKFIIVNLKPIFLQMFTLITSNGWTLLATRLHPRSEILSCPSGLCLSLDMASCFRPLHCLGGRAGRVASQHAPPVTKHTHTPAEQPCWFWMSCRLQEIVTLSHTVHAGCLIFSLSCRLVNTEQSLDWSWSVTSAAGVDLEWKECSPPWPWGVDIVSDVVKVIKSYAIFTLKVHLSAADLLPS